MSLFFVNQTHEDSMAMLLELIEVPSDPEYFFPIYILSAIGCRTGNTKIFEIMHCVSPWGIDFEQLLSLSRPWSSSEKSLIRIAAHMFNSQFGVNIRYCLAVLDHHYRRVVYTALSIAYPCT